ncbi:MAG: polysaccharide deacetylase family protein [Patescibacteria group bacterium]|jgi:hypothetical protein
MRKIVTTSWDDGNKLDLKLLNLLNKYNLKGTFYIPKNLELKSLTGQEIKLIAETQEIGAHTLNHPNLTSLVSDEEIKREIKGSKDFLEQFLGREIKMFAYPGGKFDFRTKQAVKEAGFIAARTTREFEFGISQDKFEFATTIHVYPFPFRKRDKDHYYFSRFLFQPLQNSFFQILKLKLPKRSFFSWHNLSQALFDCFLKEGGVYHLWGHSWEIEKYDMWDDLETVFKYMANRSECQYLTNGQSLEQTNL